MISKKRYLKLKAERREMSFRLRRYKVNILLYNRLFNYDRSTENLKVLRNYQLAISNLRREYNLINDLIQTTKELIKLKGIK